MPRPRVPNDLYVTNGWWLEVAGLTAPHFTTFEGIGITTGTTSIVDGGSNIEYNFAGQILKTKEMTLTRPLDGSADDIAIDALYNKCLREGYKFPCALVKTHNGTEVFRFAFNGFRFKDKGEPTLDVGSEDKYSVTYTATCDIFYKV